MLIKMFAKEVISLWNRYLTQINNLKIRGYLRYKEHEILFPSILLVTETEGFFIAELIGAGRNFNGLNLKMQRVKTITSYFNQFEDPHPDSVFLLDGGNIGMRNLSLAQNADLDLIKDRFPFIELFPPLINRINASGGVLSFGNNFSSCYIENCCLVNRRLNIFRCKNILELFVLKKTATKNQIISLFNEITKGNEIKGIHLVRKGREESLIVSGQLQSLYLSPGIRETTIGEFINKHPELIKSAFKTSHFVYEPYLEWLEHDGSVDDIAINPDLLVRREDGYYDIYDLKTAVLARTKIVKGRRKRRRFIDYVEEGVAQLANYREYFHFSKNRQLAREKYGIEINEPKLILIVGSWENTNRQEIDQACRRYSDIQILDFDTLIHLFIGIEIH